MRKNNYKKICLKLKKIEIRNIFIWLTINSVLIIVSLLLLYLCRWTISGLPRKVISIILSFSLLFWLHSTIFSLPHALGDLPRKSVSKGEYKLIQIYYRFSEIATLIIILAIGIGFIWGIFGSFSDLFKLMREIINK